MTPSREGFWNIPIGEWILYPLAFVAASLFAYAIYRRARLWGRGRPGEGLKDTRKRVLSFIGLGFSEGLGHSRMLRDPYPGLIHLLLFWGGVVFLAGTTLDFLNNHWFPSLLQGKRCLAFALGLDVFGLLALLGVLMAAYRRYVQKPQRLDNTGADAVALLLVFLLLLTGFMVEGFRIAATNPEWERWSVVGYLFSRTLTGLGKDSLLLWHRTLWWGHSLLALGSMVYVSLSFSKLAHILAGPLNVFLRPLTPRGALAPIDLERAATLGAARIEEFDWKQLLDLDACTRCGRCQDRCPAHLSGKPLSPKKLIQDLKRQWLADGRSLAPGRESPEPEAVAPVTPLMGGAVSEEEIWNCTTCRACQEECPVFIQHIFKIMEMRRHLTMVRSSMPEGVQLALRNLQMRGHPWAGSQFMRLRDDWVSGVDIPLLSQGKGSETLLWVGCTGALADRNVKVTLAIVEVLKRAGFTFSILGGEESCCGDPARRMGYEVQFQLQAQQNIEVLKGYGIKRIVTACPHCFNTFKNEYPQFGGQFEVIHHTQLLASLFDGGALKAGPAISKPLTYHDPCYLGRYNDVYQPPRQVLKHLKGQVREMKRAGMRALCCGGGGGHMWMEEKGTRINELRSEDALATRAKVVVTACPFCLQMLEEGVDRKGFKEEVEVLDIAELVNRAMEKGES